MSALLVFVIGLILGVGGVFWLATLWSRTDEGRRRVALAQAESRVLDAQTSALNRLVDIAKDAAVYDSADAPHSGWPSERSTRGEVAVIEGEVTRRSAS